MYRSRTTVEVAFDASPGSLSPLWDDALTWTELVALSYTASRGGGEFDGAVPGWAEVVLENIDGLYDPSNSSGTYYGKLLAGKPLRILEQLNLVELATSNGDGTSELTAYGTSAAIASSATTARHGVNSIRLTSGTGTIGFTTVAGASGIPVNPGEPLTGSAWVKRTSATARNVTANLRFYTAAGATVSTVTGSVVSSSTSWQQVYVSTTVPATAATVAIRLEVSSAAAGDTHYFDDIHVVPADTEGHLDWYPGGPIQVFRGSVDSWLPEQYHPGYSECIVRATGILGGLASAPVGDSLWETMVRRSKPSLWWRLGEGSELEGAIDSSGNGNHGHYLQEASGGTPITFTDGLIEQDSNGAINLDSTYQQYIGGPGYAFASTNTLALWVKAYAAATACTLFDSNSLTVTMNSSGKVAANYLGLTATCTTDIRDDQPHLILVNFASSGLLEVYVDANDAATASGTLTAARTVLRMYVGRDQAGTVAQYASITFDEVVLWQGTTLDPTWWYLAGRAMSTRPADALSPVTPRELAQYLIDVAGYPQPLGTTAAPSDGGPISVEDVPMGSVLDMLNTCASMGHLAVYEAADGTPMAEPLNYVPYLTQGTYLDAITIGQGGGTEHPYLGNPSIDYGEASVVNHLTVTRPNAASIVYTDATSIAARGQRALSLAVWTHSSRVARDVAAWVLAQYATEGRRLYGLRPNTERVTTAQAMLWLELGDVLTTKDKTVDGRTITTIVRVTGKVVSKKRTGSAPAHLVVTLALAPVRIQPMVLDSSTYGVLGSAANVGKWGP